MSRRISILDGMILIAACALGLFFLNAWQQAARVGIVTVGTTRLGSGIVAASWVYLPLTMVIIPIRLRKPRPRLRRIVRQPGFQAALVVSVSFMIQILGAALQSGAAKMSLLAVGAPVHHMGLSIAIVWVLLALCRSWRSDRSWIDRYGRAMGWTWVVLYFVAPVV
jgi:hypothetical protein